MLYGRSPWLSLSTVSVYSQPFPEPTIGSKCRPARLKGSTPAVYPARADVRPPLMRHVAPSPASQQRTRWLSLWSRPRPPPGCILPSPSSLFCPRHLFLGLNTRTLVSHLKPVSAPRPASPLPRLSSLLLREGVCAPSTLSARTPCEAAVGCSSSPLFCYPLSVSPS